MTRPAQPSPLESQPPPSAQGMAARLGFHLPTETADGQARAAALGAAQVSGRVPTSLVSYQSSGSLLVIGPEPYARSQAEALADRLRCTVLATDADGSTKTSPGAGEGAHSIQVVRAKLVELTGHLGAFSATVAVGDEPVDLARAAGEGRERFDLVLDLSRTPHIRHEVPPPGYYAPGRDADALYRALAEIPELVGEFEKPKFFHYDADICAHAASGLNGCNRCLDACPTGAITSLAERIEVDPYLCQGGGSCATACPTGAITYTYPQVSDLLAEVRALLATYRERGGTRGSLLFHDGGEGRAWMAEIGPAMPERLLPFEVEEIGGVGMDAWLSVLAYGASEVILLAPPSTPPSARAELERQLGYARALLQGMGHSGERLRLVCAADPSRALRELHALAGTPAPPPAGFAALDEKRTTLRLAIDHLYAHAPAPVAAAPLPRGAPFGEVRFDHDACTLCMACVSVCPAAALEPGEETPALRFIEWNCVQCGLCEAACPEDAIAPSPRILYDPEKRMARRLLKQEEPFQCVVCGKPFATQSVMSRMREKLQGHWMFQKPEALRRLEMCEDCRVKDMFAREGGLIDPTRK
ncbi:MAG: 4Fe-4S dicluster domain-containing protein [Gammaproteobacteria bacterium]|nr:4Fe-4S dicluster domain-containing protein [Gammaproteobacteria bacterium]NIR85368.1 4Fe-4S dicluster domain-containing protein [Gammaproteobacteria bacterium]NIR88886.1 4Fe-4S dicluster domain-containing protein [Gammaproteobacteria bacterium]NIU06494.1 4Fe-4S dicluster domain-containing protein [Gammaproteobacteria bacterium]NIV53387.1 4Fe-4S dicluster domain-containing protein [Gammaproteobacteria bacterium]